MPATSELQTFSANRVAVAMDRDDPSIGEVKFLTDDGWYRFQLPRMDLKRLVQELQDGLRQTAQDQPEG